MRLTPITTPNPQTQIRFPPSYRRIRGHEGDCGDYTDPAVVHDAYSIYVKEKSLLKSLLRKGSSYSSTATSSSHSHSYSVLFSSATTTRPAASSRTVPAFSTCPSSGSDSSSDPPPRPAPARRISSGSELPSTASDDSSSILPKPPSMDTSVIEPPTLGKLAPSEVRTTRIPSYTGKALACCHVIDRVVMKPIYSSLQTPNAHTQTGSCST